MMAPRPRASEDGYGRPWGTDRISFFIITLSIGRSVGHGRRTERDENRNHFRYDERVGLDELL